MAVTAKGIGHAPSVKKVGFCAAGSFSIAVALRALWVDGIDGERARQKLFNRGSLIGFDCDCKMRIGSDHFLQFGPPLGTVVEGEVPDDFALLVNDNHV